MFGVSHVFFPMRIHEPKSRYVQARIEMANLIAALSQYQAIYGYPTGGGSDTAKCLLGDNPRKIVFVNWRKSQISSAGEFLDPWRTPYQINLEPSTNIIVRSAGKNTRFGDSDDLSRASRTPVQ